MSGLISFTFTFPALVLAIIVNPYLFMRSISRELNAASTIVSVCLVAIVSNCIIAVTCHLAQLPIESHLLASIHWSLFIVLAIICRIRNCCCALPDIRDLKLPGAVLALFALIVIPFTHLPDIDAYKWQDLASAIHAEQCIPWFIHPVALLGFVPRSYPSIQPIILATVQLLGRTGVGWGFYIVSLLSATLATFSCYLLGMKVFNGRKQASLFAFLYLFSSVFTRYNHWATGRGLFMAILPLLLVAILDAPRWRALLAIPLLGILLCLAHKSALFVFPLILISLLLAPLFATRFRRAATITLLVPSMMLSVLLSPTRLLPSQAGQIVGFAYNELARFGWYLPFVLTALLLPDDEFPKKLRRLIPVYLGMLPIAHFHEMYGAMGILSITSLLATAGVTAAMQRFPAARTNIVRMALALTLIGSLHIVIKQSLSGMPHRLYKAALFLEENDPGPYRLQAPGAARVQVQGYVSGCPRFSYEIKEPIKVTLRRPPKLIRDIREAGHNWVSYIRNPVNISGVRSHDYGDTSRTYLITIDGKGKVSPRAELVYDQSDVKIYRMENLR